MEAKKQQIIHIGSARPKQMAAITESEMVRCIISPAIGFKNTACVQFLPDTGAELDAITDDIYSRFLSSIHLSPAADPETAIGSTIRNLGSFNVTLDWLMNDGTSKPVSSVLHVLCDLNQPVP